MYIKKIKIENFKAISKMELRLNPGVNLLLGDNGVGKTSILDAIVVALGGYLNGVNGVSAKNILLSDIKMDTHPVGSVSTGIVYQVPVKITCEMDVHDVMIEWSRIREDETSNRKTKIDKKQGDITKYASSLTNDLSAELPIFSYQSSLRASQTRRGDFGAEMKKKIDDRRCGYLGCLDSVLDLKRIKEWCYEMERMAFDQDRKIEEYENFKNIVADVMQKLNQLKERPRIFYSRQYQDMAYSENDKITPISCLSAGYQSVLWMIMDIAYRLAVLNPGKADLTECEGIVLIDEIDMHLHPKWQWNVLKTLETIFPNIQFIIATHSPIIISSCKQGNLILIDDKQEITYLKNAYGYSVKDVLELCQGSSEILGDMKKRLEAFDKAMNVNDYERAKKILRDMTAEYGADNTEVIKAETELEYELLED